MTLLRQPTLPLPEPLRAAERNTFTHTSVVKRLPDIARRVLAENKLPPEAAAAIQALIAEIPAGTIRAVAAAAAGEECLPAQDCCGDAWAQWAAPYLGMDWLEVPWFFAEEYFYLRVLEATGYFQPGPWQGRDPYAGQKRLGLESTRARQAALAEQTGAALLRPRGTFRESLERLLLVDLWGNQNDLSMWPVSSSANGGGQSPNGQSPAGQSPADSTEAHILDNHLPAVLAYFDQFGPGAGARVDILLDNAGYELVTDLALADFLLQSGYAAQVVLHAKCHPVFVSDALETDIFDTLDFLCFLGTTPARDLAVRLRRALLEERLVLRRHPFWTSPLPAWEMPPDLLDRLNGCHLLISKGDANYRRLLGDRHWELHTPFEKVVDYLPCAVLALRTLKSEIAVGILPEAAPAQDERWMINGGWGVVQFSAPRVDSPQTGQMPL